QGGGTMWDRLPSPSGARFAEASRSSPHSIQRGRAGTPAPLRQAGTPVPLRFSRSPHGAQPALTTAVMLGQLIHFLENLQQTLLELHGLGLLVFAGILVVTQLFMLPL